MKNNEFSTIIFTNFSTYYILVKNVENTLYDAFFKNFEKN